MTDPIVPIRRTPFDAPIAPVRRVERRDDAEREREQRQWQPAREEADGEGADRPPRRPGADEDDDGHRHVDVRV